jgi:NodT family efflux transporter outer membrane factor (OMF) lipoprotein
MLSPRLIVRPLLPAWLCRVAVGAIALLAAGGCRVGPDYRPPEAPLAESWVDSNHARLRGDPLDSFAWWASFDDPVLNGLIDEVRQQNLTLRHAGTRILEARAVLGGVRGNLAPQEQMAVGGLQHTHISRNSPGQALASILQRNDYDQWTVGVAAAWELDFWGRYQRAITAASAEVDAAVENHNDVEVLLLAETAHTYLQVRTLEYRFDLAKQNVAIQRDTLEITEARARAGRGTELDALQAKSSLKETQALLPALEAQHRIAGNRLCILLGIPPRDLGSRMGRTARIPMPQAELAIGVPADLLRRRPDIRRAERELAAQSERIGIAATEFYPHLSISGNVGLDALDLSKLYSPRSWAVAVGPSFHWNILNYGRIHNSVRLQEARYQSLVLAYQNAVLKADEEAENAIIRYLSTHDRVALLQSGVESAQLAVNHALEAYRLGVLDFDRLYLLETQLVIKQDSVAVAQGELAQSLVAVYKSMGGGWEQLAR